MTEENSSPDPALPQEPTGVAVEAPEDDDVAGHLYGDYFTPQVQGRFGREAHRQPTDSSASRTSRFPRRRPRQGGSVG